MIPTPASSVSCTSYVRPNGVYAPHVCLVVNKALLILAQVSSVCVWTLSTAHGETEQQGQQDVTENRARQ